jgi:glucose-6-phosphate isomerase
MGEGEHSLWLQYPGGTWAIDASTMNVDVSALEGLPWARVWADREELEDGEPVNLTQARAVGHYWLRDPTRAATMGQARGIGESLEQLRVVVEDVSTGRILADDGERFTDVIHIGIGGSALGPQLLVDALGPCRGGLGVHFVDNTDPDGIARMLSLLGERIRHAMVVVVSKSGSTLETRNGLDLVARAMAARGLEFSGRAIAITAAGSPLDQRASLEGWCHRFPLWEWVGGRTSVTSSVGLLTGGLAGVDIEAFLDGARAMDDWTRTTDWRTNPAALLAGCWHEAGSGEGSRAMVVLPYSDRLLLLARYLQQLVMESLGKREDRQGEEVFQGLTVYGNKGSTDQHALVQQLRDGTDDTFVQFVQVLSDGQGDTVPLQGVANAGDYLQALMLGTRRALREQNRPCMTLTLDALTPFALGGVVALFERSVGFYATLIDVNAYDQPGVEAGKLSAKNVINLAERLMALLDGNPRSAETLAQHLDADRMEVWSIMERYVATGRAVRHNRGYMRPTP